MNKNSSKQACAADCVHCHKCRDNCAFLSKYNIDIGDTDRLKELAYHCFLCGRCTDVCPIGIDGREIILDFRRERFSSEEKTSIEKNYKGLINEKKDYKFSNWKHISEASSGVAYFPGCNFPSMFPKTNSHLEKLFAKYGISTIYECCGKPIAELGMKADEDAIIRKIRTRLSENGISEIVTACPNCRHFFGDRLGVNVTSVYTKLNELGEGLKLDGDVCFYMPCPDRYERKWVEEISPFITGKVTCIDPAQCCGLGGSAMSCEKELADGFVKDLEKAIHDDKPGDSTMYTYCASCMGRFYRSGMKEIDHILPYILGTYEKPDTGKSYLNRVLTKFK